MRGAWLSAATRVLHREGMAVYAAADVREDAGGYGLVHYVAQGTQVVLRGPVRGFHDTYLMPKHAETFLHSRDALVGTARETRIYRFHGVGPGAEAQIVSGETPARVF